MAVHLSVQLANWALSVTGPTVNSDRWNALNRAVFQHFRFYYRNHRLLSGNDPLLPLRRMNEADRGEKNTTIQRRCKYNASALTSHSCLELGHHVSSESSDSCYIEMALTQLMECDQLVSNAGS